MRRYLAGDMVRRLSWDVKGAPRLSGPNRWIVRDDENENEAGFMPISFDVARVVGAWVHRSDIALIISVEGRVAEELMA